MKEERRIIGKEGIYPLKGILTLPDGPLENVPAVVLVHGSGPNDMDVTIGKNKPFKDLAEGFAKLGVATIRYDKRTKVYGRQMVKESTEITVGTETIEDAILATEILRDDPRIGKVFILGHSMGGMLAPRIDAEGGNYDGIIIAAGTPRELRDLMRDQFEAIINKQKGPLKALIGWQLRKIVNKLDTVEDMTLEESRTKKFIGNTSGYYFKEFEEHPTRDYLLVLDKPVYIFQGAEDFQVYADKDFVGYQGMLKEKDNVTFKLYHGVNHILTNSVEFQSAKDYKVPGKVDQEVIDDLAAWIKKV